MIKSVSITNFLSLGPEPQKAELKDLNILTGQSGSGKTNFLSAIDVLRKATLPYGFPDNICGADDALELLHKGNSEPKPAVLEFVLENREEATCSQYPELRYTLSFFAHSFYFTVIEEKVTGLGDGKEYPFYSYENGVAVIREKNGELQELGDSKPAPTQTALALFRNQEKYPLIAWLSKEAGKMGIYKDWTLGSNSPARMAGKVEMDGSRLYEDFSNLPIVLKGLEDIKAVLVEKIQMAYESVTGYEIEVKYGVAKLYIQEEGMSCRVPVTRISDGLLRYICLLCILYGKSPGSVICIDEFEAGLDDSAIPLLLREMKERADRVQLIVASRSLESIAHKESIANIENLRKYVLVVERVGGATRLGRMK
ncbi:MAG: AAA family ATPase [Clostridiales bacterium]|nr:AAA family ATPase [Clostridiales bacterium]